ncbi:MAG TPA: C13 family peptidase [Burkholderiales bacterium]|nr:C13 family peptidase [Burkholderiales bacterium]
MTFRLALVLLLIAAGAHAADGLPDAITSDGGRYFGSLRDAKPNGRGRVEWDSGARYAGEFANGRFDGRGRFESASGEIFEGDFDKGEFTGHGTYSRADGARYRGQFVNWRMHGEGRYSDGKGEIYEGEFVDGVFKPLAEHRRLLDAALAAMAPGRPGVIELYLLAVGGDGSQEVFRREVEFVRAQFDERFGTRSRSLALVNSRNIVAPMATVSSIGEALKGIGERMNRDEDILFLFLTSHGSREHELKLQQNQMTLRDLPARELASMLRSSGVRWKVIVVSACYSGGFIDALRDDYTLIITASRHDRSSFGCADEADFTYFGRAFFKEALPASRSFQDAFAKADALVAEWERKDLPKEPRSLPQLHTTPSITSHLQRWAEQQR